MLPEDLFLLTILQVGEFLSIFGRVVPGFSFEDCYHSLPLTLSFIPVVCQYLDIFLDELPGMLPDRAVEFAIELEPGTALISK